MSVWCSNQLRITGGDGYRDRFRLLDAHPARGSYAIEHVMPQAWAKHWSLPARTTEADRDARIHRFGNLTLLTSKLNATVSNGPWLGEGGKAAHLQEKDVVLLNSKLLKEYSAKQWDEDGVDQRTSLMIDSIVAIWAVPPGHKVQIDREHAAPSVTVEIADLISAGYLSSGQPLYSRPGKYGGHTGRILSDGSIEVAGQVFEVLQGRYLHSQEDHERLELLAA